MNTKKIAYNLLIRFLCFLQVLYTFPASAMDHFREDTLNLIHPDYFTPAFIDSYDEGQPDCFLQEINKDERGNYHISFHPKVWGQEKEIILHDEQKVLGKIKCEEGKLNFLGSQESFILNGLTSYENPITFNNIEGNALAFYEVPLPLGPSGFLHSFELSRSKLFKALTHQYSLSENTAQEIKNYVAKSLRQAFKAGSLPWINKALPHLSHNWKDFQALYQDYQQGNDIKGRLYEYSTTSEVYWDYLNESLGEEIEDTTLLTYQLQNSSFLKALARTQEHNLQIWEKDPSGKLLQCFSDQWDETKPTKHICKGKLTDNTVNFSSLNDTPPLYQAFASIRMQSAGDLTVRGGLFTQGGQFVAKKLVSDDIIDAYQPMAMVGEEELDLRANLLSTSEVFLKGKLLLNKNSTHAHLLALEFEEGVNNFTGDFGSETDILLANSDNSDGFTTFDNFGTLRSKGIIKQHGQDFKGHQNSQIFAGVAQVFKGTTYQDSGTTYAPNHSIIEADTIAFEDGYKFEGNLLNAIAESHLTTHQNASFDAEQQISLVSKDTLSHKGKIFLKTPVSAYPYYYQYGVKASLREQSEKEIEAAFNEKIDATAHDIQINLLKEDLSKLPNGYGVCLYGAKTLEKIGSVAAHSTSVQYGGENMVLAGHTFVTNVFDVNKCIIQGTNATLEGLLEGGSQTLINLKENFNLKGNLKTAEVIGSAKTATLSGNIDAQRVSFETSSSLTQEPTSKITSKKVVLKSLDELTLEGKNTVQDQFIASAPNLKYKAFSTALELYLRGKDVEVTGEIVTKLFQVIAERSLKHTATTTTKTAEFKANTAIIEGTLNAEITTVEAEEALTNWQANLKNFYFKGGILSQRGVNNIDFAEINCTRDLILKDTCAIQHLNASAHNYIQEGNLTGRKVTLNLHGSANIIGDINLEEDYQVKVPIYSFKGNLAAKNTHLETQSSTLKGNINTSQKIFIKTPENFDGSQATFRSGQEGTTLEVRASSNLGKHNTPGWITLTNSDLAGSLNWLTRPDANLQVGGRRFIYDQAVTLNTALSAPWKIGVHAPSLTLNCPMWSEGGLEFASTRDNLSVLSSLAAPSLVLHSAWGLDTYQSLEAQDLLSINAYGPYVNHGHNACAPTMSVIGSSIHYEAPLWTPTFKRKHLWHWRNTFSPSQSSITAHKMYHEATHGGFINSGNLIKGNIFHHIKADANIVNDTLIHQNQYVVKGLIEGGTGIAFKRPDTQVDSKLGLLIETNQQLINYGRLSSLSNALVQADQGILYDARTYTQDFSRTETRSGIFSNKVKHFVDIRHNVVNPEQYAQDTFYLYSVNGGLYKRGAHITGNEVVQVYGSVFSQQLESQFIDRVFVQRRASPLASLAIGTAITLATGGAGIGLAGALNVTNAVAVAAINAAATATVSQLGANTLAHKGNVGRAFKEIDWTGVAIEGISAGITKGISKHYNIAQPTPTLKALETLSNTDLFLKHLQYNAIKTSVSTALNVSFGRQDLGQGILSGMRSVVVDSVANVCANRIGESYWSNHLNYGEHKLVHMGVGGMRSLLKGGDFWAGAAGAGISEFCMEGLNPDWRTRTVNTEQEQEAYQREFNVYNDISKFFTGLGAQALSLDVVSAVDAGTQAIENNANLTKMWASILGAAGLGHLVGENVEENLAFAEGVEEAQKQAFGENDNGWIRFGYHFGNAVAQEEGMRPGDGYRTLYSMRKSAQGSSNIVRKTPSLMSDMWRGNTLNSSRLENYASDWGNFSLGVISNLGAISGLGSGKGRVTAQPNYTQTHLSHNPFSSFNSVPHLHNYSGVLTSANRNLPFANPNRMVIPQQSTLTGTGNSGTPVWVNQSLNNSAHPSNIVMTWNGNGSNDGITFNRGNHGFQSTSLSGREDSSLINSLIRHGHQYDNSSHYTFILPKVANRNGISHSRSEISDIETQRIYNPHRWRIELEATYGKNNVTSTTLQRPGTRGYNMMGKRHPATRITYDDRSNPNFSSVMKYETLIEPKDFYKKSRATHMRAATRKLRDDIQLGKMSSSLFTQDQLANIIKGKAQIQGFTWHHDQQARRMQLINSYYHDTTEHTGSVSLQGLKE